MKEEEEIFKLMKGLRIRIADVGEFRFDEKQAKEIAHKLYIEQGEQ